MNKSFKCQTCWKTHHFPAYVFAHWNETLTHECDGCGAKHDILSGYAKLMKAGTTTAPDTSNGGKS
jgi:hypothetical protein